MLADRGTRFQLVREFQARGEEESTAQELVVPGTCEKMARGSCLSRHLVVLTGN